MLLVASCYRYRDKLWPDEQHGSIICRRYFLKMLSLFPLHMSSPDGGHLSDIEKMYSQFRYLYFRYKMAMPLELNRASCAKIMVHHTALYSVPSVFRYILLQNFFKIKTCCNVCYKKCAFGADRLWLAVCAISTL